MAYKTYLVEDSPLIRENLVGFLEEVADAQVVACAATERDAVAWLGTHRNDWDLAVIDLFLLQGNGFAVLKVCRDRRADQKVVVLSNYATNDMRQRSEALGADAFFDKSAELEQFLAWCETEMSHGLRTQGRTH